MVFDPSEFEGPSFDLYICKMLISIFSWFFHTIFKDLTEQILYPNATECTILHPSEKQFSGRGVGGGKPQTPYCFQSLEGWHVCRLVRRTGTFGNPLVLSDNRNTRSTCPTSVFTGIGQTLMSRPVGMFTGYSKWEQINSRNQVQN